MSLLTELKTLLTTLQVPVETGVFTDDAPDEFTVLVPIYDNFELYADGKPNNDIQSVRISLFSKNNYTKTKKSIIKALLTADISITSRQYIGFETDTKYHHYNIDVEKLYGMEEYT